VNRSHFLTLCAGALGLAGASLLLAQPPAPPRKVALVALPFDNQTPDDPATQGVADISSETMRVMRALLRHGWDVRFLKSLDKIYIQPPASELPTEANLRAYLKGLRALKPDDEVIVVLVTRLVALDTGGGSVRCYVCPQDAAYRGLAKAAQVRAEHHLLGLDEVYDYLRACPARKKLLVLMTAVSSTFRPGKYAPPLCARLPKLPPPPAGLAVLTSCAEGEFTSNRAHFLDAFQEGLEKAQSRDGVLTIGGLIAHVQAEVQKKASSYAELSFKQSPQVLGQLPRDWILVGGAGKPAGPLLVAPFSARAAKERQGQLARERKLASPVLTNGIGMKLVLLPPGEFRMGSAEGGAPDERPPVRVRLARPFFLGQYEVTQAQYQRVMGENPSHFKEVADQDTSAFPVERVTFKQAVLFCNALSAREKLPPYYALLGVRRDKRTGRVIDFLDCTPTRGPGYRLPSEAEWEYACRAGTTTAFHFGDTADGAKANVDANRPGGVKAGAYLGRTCKVGSYAANAFGLHDMHGNVWELCEDRYDPGRYKALAGKVSSGASHEGRGGLARGGAWNFPPQDGRSAARMAVSPRLRYPFVGFRVARYAE
jgi:formylglycine-generating enzyme required for sulfatase activity